MPTEWQCLDRSKPPYEAPFLHSPPNIHRARHLSTLYVGSILRDLSLYCQTRAEGDLFLSFGKVEKWQNPSKCKVPNGDIDTY